MQLVYSTTPVNWATRCESLAPLQRCSWCILPPQSTGPPVVKVLHLCRDAVGVFYRPSQLGHPLWKSCTSAEMQLVYSTTPVNWATRCESLAPLQRCSWCILPPQSTGPPVVKVLHLCRDAVGVFYRPSQRGHSLWKSCTSAEMQLVYSTAPVNGATRCESLAPLQRCSWCILPPQSTGPLVVKVLHLCRDAVGVFYRPSQLGHSLWKSCTSAEMQLVYFTAPANWATRCGSLAPLQRCSWCILQHQPTRPLVVGVLPLCREALYVFYCTSQLGHSLWMSCPFCREAVGVFYSTSQLGHSLWESCPSAEKHFMYSTAPANWVTRCGSFFPSAEKQSVYFTVPANRAM